MSFNITRQLFNILRQIDQGLPIVSRHSIKSLAFYGARELLADLHADPWQIARMAGLPLEALDQVDLLLPADLLLRFLQVAAEQTGRDDFGLLLAQRQSMGVVGVLQDVLNSAGSLREWLQQLSQYFFLVTTAATVQLEEHALGMMVYYECTTTGEDDSQAELLGMGLLARKLRSAIDPHWSSERVTFRFRAPRRRALYRQVFGQHLLFNQERTGLLLSWRALEQPLPSAQAPSLNLAVEFMRQSLQRHSKDSVLMTEDAVRKLLGHNAASLEAVACEQLKSRRTLQRKLAGSGTSFQAIKTQARLDLACKYLRQSDMRLSQIAELLGFSSLSAFSRFFANAMGCAPGHYRRQSAAN